MQILDHNVRLNEFIQFPFSDSKFTQQELPACKPILTPKWVILYFKYLQNLTCTLRFQIHEHLRNQIFDEIFVSLQVISAFMLVSIVFIPIGVASLFASREVCSQSAKFFFVFFLSLSFFLICCCLCVDSNLFSHPTRLLK